MNIAQSTIQPVEAPLHQPPQPHQPHQPPQPHQPQPQATAYSSEPSMHTNAGEEGVTQVTVILDKDSLKIIQDASMVHSESIVNLGIKLFAKTNIYKEFMLKAGTVPLDTSTEDLQTLTQAVAGMEPSSGDISAPDQGTPKAPSTPSASGFASW